MMRSTGPIWEVERAVTRQTRSKATVLITRRAFDRCIESVALIERAPMNGWRVYQGCSHQTLSMRRICSVTAAVVLTLLVFSLVAAWAEPAIKPQEIPKVLVEKGKNLSALKAVMAVSTTSQKEGQRQDVRGFLLYRRPNDFRFQGLAPGGNSLFEIVMRSDKFKLYVPAESKMLVGGRSCFFERFPDVAELESLIPLALLQWKNASLTQVLSEDQNRFVLGLNYGGHNWRVTLDAQNLLLVRIEKMGLRSVELIADFGDYGEGEYGWLPRRFDVRSTQGAWRTLVKISKIEINPFLVQKNFELEPAFSPKIEECK